MSARLVSVSCRDCGAMGEVSPLLARRARARGMRCLTCARAVRTFAAPHGLDALGRARKRPNEARETVPAIGARVAHVESGATGVVIGRPIPARSAAGALMVRVRWDHSYARDDGSAVFVRRLRVLS